MYKDKNGILVVDMVSDFKWKANFQKKQMQTKTQQTPKHKN